MCDIISSTRGWTHSPCILALGGQSLSPWATGEVPRLLPTSCSSTVFACEPPPARLRPLGWPWQQQQIILGYRRCCLNWGGQNFYTRVSWANPQALPQSSWIKTSGSLSSFHKLPGQFWSYRCHHNSISKVSSWWCTSVYDREGGAGRPLNEHSLWARPLQTVCVS